MTCLNDAPAVGARGPHRQLILTGGDPGGQCPHRQTHRPRVGVRREIDQTTPAIGDFKSGNLSERP
ncbi:hypothetical protein, partial [Streptomyces sp. SID5643]|uniref:hypothetical protein n=1 Tax=Streptomyces sp. SID5643 TaxID=2690307 RepID=UPI001F375A56